MGGISDLSLQGDHSRRHARTLEIGMMYSNGIPVEEIGSKYEISKSQVLRIARNFGLPKRPRGFDPTRKAAVLAALRAGMKLSAISALYNVSEAYASMLAKANGLSRYKKKVV